MVKLQDKEYCKVLNEHLTEFYEKLENLSVAVNSPQFDSNIEGIVEYYNSGHPSFDYKFDFEGMNCVVQFITLGLADIFKLGLNLTSRPMPYQTTYQFKDVEIVPNTLLAICIDIEGTIEVIKKDISIRMHILKKIEEHTAEK